MADETNSTPSDDPSSQQPPVTAVADKPDFFHKVASLIFDRPKKSGAHCEYCGWSGPTSDVLKSPRMNEDGNQYMINTCPQCMRNGGLVFYD